MTQEGKIKFYCARIKVNSEFQLNKTLNYSKLIYFQCKINLRIVKVFKKFNTKPNCIVLFICTTRITITALSPFVASTYITLFYSGAMLGLKKC